MDLAILLCTPFNAPIAAISIVDKRKIKHKQLLLELHGRESICINHW